MHLIIEVCEGGFYLAKLSSADHSDRGLRIMCNQYGLVYKANMRFNSLGHIRDYFAPLAPRQVWLQHNTAYDEMIGLPSGEASYRQPLYWYSDAPHNTIAKRA